MMTDGYLDEQPERQEISLVDRIEGPDLQRGKRVQVRCRNPNGSPTQEEFGEGKTAIRKAASQVPGTGDVDI